MAGTMKIRYGRRIDSFNIIIADTISFIVPFLKVVLLNDTKWNQCPLAFEPGLSSRYCFPRDKKLSYYKGSWNTRIFNPGFALKACKLSLGLPFIHLSNLYKPYLSFLNKLSSGPYSRESGRAYIFTR